MEETQVIASRENGKLADMLRDGLAAARRGERVALVGVTKDEGRHIMKSDLYQAQLVRYQQVSEFVVKFDSGGSFTIAPSASEVTAQRVYDMSLQPVPSTRPPRATRSKAAQRPPAPPSGPPKPRPKARAGRETTH